MIEWNDFVKVEMRVGTVLQAEKFPDAKKPAYKLTVDFGEFGVKRSSAQITKLYSAEALIGRQVIAVINFPPKQIANFFSECLVLGIDQNDGEVVLLSVDKNVNNGSRIS
jgi:tRNA-binding protein